MDVRVAKVSDKDDTLVDVIVFRLSKADNRA